MTDRRKIWQDDAERVSNALSIKKFIQKIQDGRQLKGPVLNHHEMQQSADFQYGTCPSCCNVKNCNFYQPIASETLSAFSR